MATQETDPDVHADRPEVGLQLQQAGYSEVEKVFTIAQEDQPPIAVSAEFGVYVDLPSSRLGVDMSRNIIALNEALEEAASNPEYTIETVCERAAETLYGKHDYTSRAEVVMDGKFIHSEDTPESDLLNEEAINIFGGAVVGDDENSRKIGVKVPGMLACPCTQGASDNRARNMLSEFGVDQSDADTFVNEVPQMTHSQCSYGTLILEGENIDDVSVSELIEIVHDSMSSRVYNTLKRTDEDHIVQSAHETPRVTEDSVRLMAKGIVNQYPDLPDDIAVTLEEWSDESIHQHNARSKLSTTVGSLRSKLA